MSLVTDMRLKVKEGIKSTSVKKNVLLNEIMLEKRAKTLLPLGKFTVNGLLGL